MILGNVGITVIISKPNINGDLTATVNSLKEQQNACYEVILVGEDSQYCDFTTVADKNEALSKAQYPYVMFMNAGDTVNPCFMECCISALEGRPAKKIYFEAVPATEAEDNAFGEGDSISEEDSAVKRIPDLAVGKFFCNNPLVSDSVEEHILSRNYVKSGKIKNIFSTPRQMFISLDALVFRTEKAKEIGFNLKLAVDADINFILRYLLENPNYANASQAQYFYTQIKDDKYLYCENALKKEWYAHSLYDFLFPLLEDVKVGHEKITSFFQNYCMHYINCRFFANMNDSYNGVIEGEELKYYFEDICNMLSFIDDEFILNQDLLPYYSKNPALKCLYLTLKYGEENIKYDFHISNKKVPNLEMWFNNYHISNLYDNSFVIDAMEYTDGRLCLKGNLSDVFKSSGLEYFVRLNGVEYPVVDTGEYCRTEFFGIIGYCRLTYNLELPLDGSQAAQKVKFYAKYKGKRIPMRVDFSTDLSKLSNTFKHSYWQFDKYLCTYSQNKLSVKRVGFWDLLKAKRALLQEIRNKEKQQRRLHKSCKK